METAAIVVGALLAVAAVLFVSRPFLRRGGDEGDELAERGAAELRRLELEEERDRALGALRELEFDHRTGKVSDEDYRALVGELRLRAGEALRALDAGRAKPVSQSEQPGTPLPDPVPHEPVEPPRVPDPTPVPHEPVEPPRVPDPTPVPHEPVEPPPSLGGSPRG